MAAIDAAAAASGIPSFDLMERAGQAVAASVLAHYPGAVRAVVLCGPGNNGGDGYVAARALHACGMAVALHASGDTARLSGDARRAFALCPLVPQPLALYAPQKGDVVIDALFGAGLSRPVPDDVAQLVHTVTRLGLPVVAVDLPSGLCGRRGVVLGAAFAAQRTVTFVARKPGHVLMPGRELCGEVEVFDIGIPRRIVDTHAEGVAVNGPRHWVPVLPQTGLASHKYTRGHLTVFAGPAHATGAARLSATAGLKAGAGLVTIAAPREALDVLAQALTAVMIADISDEKQLAAWLADERHGAFVLGPGFGDLRKARVFVQAMTASASGSPRALVLDADGITAFRDEPEALFAAFHKGGGRYILTPHDGEFRRLFADIAADESFGKIGRAQAAAARSGAVVILKGADTVIAAPDGRALVNTGAPPWLATAGSGDVLAGICGALLAQGVPAFEAASAAVWLHGEAARRAGAGMTAEDLAQAVRPSVT